MEAKPENKEKIILPKNLQREMIKFFMTTSMPRLQAKAEEEKQKSLENSKEDVE